MKRFKVRPAEVFALEFEDGKEIQMSFNMKALSILGELINNKKVQLNSPQFISAIIYSGCKSMNEDFTEEEANALYVQLQDSQPEAMEAILNEYFDASGIDKEELKKKLLQTL